MKRYIGLLALLILCVSACAAETLRVMTFNVRLPTRGDAINRWEIRQDILLATIRLKNPDLIGTQELFYIQGEYIAQNLPEYEWFGNSRRGNREDEHMGIFYKRSKLRLIEAGNFWLSDTPEVAGSQAWGATLPRMVTWGLFEIRASGKRFYHFNTHFQHTAQGEQARVNSAKLIAERIAKLPSDVPLILTGDFNSPALESQAYKILSASSKDAWFTAAHRVGPEGTLSGFRGGTGGRRIDWILYRGPFSVAFAETVTYNENGRYPSDHYPVFAVFELE